MISRQFLRSLLESIASYLVDRLLATDQNGAALRRLSLILIGGIAWAIIGANAHPFTSGPQNLITAVLYPLKALFAADVFKHILIGALAFWLAYRAAANYLQDIFELRDIRVAERFIRQAAFASRYDVIEILNGEVAEKDKKSPIFLVGGPGMVRVYLENAALFEKIDGQPEVIEPTTPRSGAELAVAAVESRRRKIMNSLFLSDGAMPTGDGVKLLEGFERLRRIIDLRDQVETMTVHGRTRDGIPVRASDLRFIFSVRRDDEPPTLRKPYPFNHEAFKQLVYSLPKQAFIPTISSQINRELGTFISNHSLGEFLAAIGWPEVQPEEPVAAENSSPAPVEDMIGNGAPPPFVARPEISDLFYDYNQFVNSSRQIGVELRWIGIGTWVLPDGIIPERHVQAWRLTQENLIRGSRTALRTVYRESYGKGSMAAIRRTPLETARKLDLTKEELRQNNMIALIHSYRGALRAALDIYSARDQTDSPGAVHLDQVWNHLTHVVARYIGDEPEGE